MSSIAKILIGLVAIEHLYFLIIEMFLWTTPVALNAFHLTPALAEETRAMAANQGLYNGFLSAGLLWSLLRHARSRSVAIFFLSCVIIAGIFGCFTVTPSILYIQAVPAITALAVVVWGGRRVRGMRPGALPFNVV
jgi:putative membrane protein